MGGLLFVTLVWAFSFSLMKEELFPLGIPFSAVVAIRLVLAVLVFSWCFRYKVSLKLAIQLMLLGAIMMGVMNLAVTKAVGLIPAHLVGLMTVFTPFYISLMEDIRTGRFRPRWWLPAILSIVGAGLIKYEGIPEGDLIAGILLVQLANISFALGQVYFRHLSFHYQPKRDIHWMGWIYLGALVPTIPFWFDPQMWGGDSFWGKLTPRAFLVLLFLGLISSGLCYWIWNHSASRVSGPVLAVFNNLHPPATALVAILLFGETTDWVRLIAGGGVIFAALALATWLAPKREH